MDEDDDGVCSADLEAEAEMEKQWMLPPSVVHANQEAQFYAYSFTEGANEDETGRTSSNPFSDSTGAH